MTIPSPDKLMHPIIPPSVLHRRALLAELTWATGERKEQNETDTNERYRVILLRAPAGYGKTTLLADFARQSSLACCWYFLDESDENPTAFLQLLVQSIRQHFPHFGLSLDALIAKTNSVESEQRLAYLTALTEMLAQTIATEIQKNFALLLCNYHELNPQSTSCILINHFIQNMPARCTLLLESRSMPALDFVFLLAHQLFLEIGQEKMRFSAQEIQALARLQHGELTQEDVAYLERTFEGWITGILLATRLGSMRVSDSVIDRHKESYSQPGREQLFAYLVKYVFTNHAEAYHFLRETCVLRYMTPTLCDALLHTSDAAEQLAWLVEQGLFVTHFQNGQEDIFVCLPILRELLYEELQHLAPLHLTQLHLQAVELFRGQKDTEAIAHALAAQDFRGAARLIETVASQLLAAGEQLLLASLLDELPVEIKKEYPRLLLTRASLFLEESVLPEVQNLLDQAMVVEEDTPSLRAEILLMRAKLLMQQGDYLLARELSVQALLLMEHTEVDLQVTAHQIQASCAAYLNDFTTSIAELQQALQISGHAVKTHPVAKLHTMLANFYGMTGHNALSEHHRMRAIECWTKLNDEWGKIDNILGLGAIKERQGFTEEALDLFNQALNLSRGPIRYRCGEAYALASLGDCHQDQDNFRQALIVYEDSLALSRQLDEAYLVHYTICQLARTYLLLEDPHGALSISAQLDTSMPPVQAIASYEQALYAFTRGTLYLYMGQVETALACFSAAEVAFRKTKYEYIQVMIYKAACFLALDETQSVLRQAEAFYRCAKACGYEVLVWRELRWYKPLLRYLQVSAPALLTGLQEHMLSPEETLTREQKIVDRVESQHVPVLTIHALGTPAIYRDGLQLKQWRTSKSLELFFLLLNAPHALHKERIIADLWPEQDEVSNQTWRSTLHYVRKMLGADCIHAHNGVYKLQLETMYVMSYDVQDFQRLAAEASNVRRMGDDETAKQAYEAMIEMYKGDFVASFYSNWCVLRRYELRQLCIEAHYQLASMAWQRQSLDESIHHWQALIAMDSMAEAAHEGLLRCYIQQGKRHLALYHYQQYVSFLQQELGILPGETIQSLVREAH